MFRNRQLLGAEAGIVQLLGGILVACVGVLVLFGCSVSEEDLSFPNPEWKDTVASSVTFPLAEPIELRVGVDGRAVPTSDNAAVRWLTEATNITFSFEAIPSSPGDVALGELVRSGKLYDLIPEGRLRVSDPGIRKTLVNFRDFPALVPNSSHLAATEPLYRDGLAAKMTLDGELFSLGSYDPNRIPFVGTLAYRRDLFEKHHLGFSTWEELADSLRTLKELYPDSTPFGATPHEVYYMLPALFGSGMVENQIVYYDSSKGGWVFGPYEPEFKAFVRYFAELASEGIFASDMFVVKEDELPRYFSTDTVFIAPYPGLTGPYFRYSGDGYGKVDKNGLWDGKGKWIESMPVPEHGAGLQGRITSRLYSYVGKGWNVYNQSEHVAEAIALLDFLFDPMNALSARLGPAGTIWNDGPEGPALLPEYASLYATRGLKAVLDSAQKAGITAGIPFSGIIYTAPSAFFGKPSFKEYLYYTHTDVLNYPPGVSIPLQPGLRIAHDSDFDLHRATTNASLEAFIQSEVAQFIVGNRPLSEYDDFIAECKKNGSDDLLELYRSNSNLFTGSLF